ncbi:Senescence domain-containing protein [Mycena sanguinolenta]|uniref:Senescence domain-containing protein n=1 Tax=Mycena sanguinolenta TaxID=230812 RepID=A0A8H6YJ29_9AGAR|nr:Senescence domain-containing protein [Mycena sanguinolenta]
MSATLDVDAFLLLTLSNCSLLANGSRQSGSLALECVTIQFPDAPLGRDSEDRHLYLVLRMNELEFPIDPTTRIALKISEAGSRNYTFMATDAEPELVVTIVLPNFPDPHFLEDVEVFEGILAQYADFQNGLTSDPPEFIPNIYDKADSDELRGHLVLVNQDNGEVVGEFDKKFSVQEDPALSERGHEKDLVIIEVPESTDNAHYDADAMRIFASAIPPEQQDWITKSATMISHAISGSTTLLIAAISAGSSFYMNRSKPSPRVSSSSSAGKSEPPPLPPRAVAFLSSAHTRKGLAAVHSVSGQAVKVSAKTVAIIDGMVKPTHEAPTSSTHTITFLFLPGCTAPVFELSERETSSSPSPTTVSFPTITITDASSLSLHARVTTLPNASWILEHRIWARLSDTNMVQTLQKALFCWLERHKTSPWFISIYVVLDAGRY